MHFTAIVSVLAAGASLVAASPIAQRDTVEDYNIPPGGDITILNYALTLEFLERKFYREGIANYTQQQFIDAGFPDPFYKNLKEIVLDEEVCQAASPLRTLKLTGNRHTSPSFQLLLETRL